MIRMPAISFKVSMRRYKFSKYSLSCLSKSCAKICNRLTCLIYCAKLVLFKSKISNCIKILRKKIGASKKLIKGILSLVSIKIQH